ncbi:MAG: ZIP family metal transporter [Deltaproteobacteria bacterium]|nr:ZIP family metal transporter [Deltaproteobacteria bacterium]
MEIILSQYSSILLALLGGLFTYLLTTIGASGVFFIKRVNERLLDLMLGLAAGIMIAASFWSLLSPSIELSEKSGYVKWLPPAIGFLLGAAFLRIVDMFLPHLHIGLAESEKEGIKTSFEKTTLFVLAVTIHNIPEGLSIGVAFGSLTSEESTVSIMAAVSLTLGIGIQNIPEGLAISLPLRTEGFSRTKSFFYGQLSGIVEPISALIGAMAVSLIEPILPYALSFAAGAMIYVVVEELIPESQVKGNSDIATIGTIVGFTIMMILDIALG